MRNRKKIKAVKSLIPFVTAIIISVSGSILVKVALNPVIVNGVSMIPTYRNGDILKSDNISDKNDLTRGSIIVIKAEHKKMIKRLVALPGDKVQIIDGYLYINNVVDNSSGFDLIDDPGCAIHPMTLQANEYFVLGDNRNRSNDSRNFGPIPLENIKGKVTGKILER